MIASKDPSDARLKIAVLVKQHTTPSTGTDGQSAGSDAYTAPWMYYFLRHDPVMALRAVRVPVLAVAGGRDLQVPPKEDLEIIKRALAGDHDVSIVEIPGLNHLLQTARTGSPREYGSIDGTMSPVAIKTIGDWVIEHGR